MSSEQKTDNIHDTMPILVSNEGVWEGWYRYYDAKTGARHRRHAVALEPDLGSGRYGEYGLGA